MFLVNWAIKYISQKIFRENHWNKFGVEDPYYDVYEIEERSFFTGSTKVKKLRKPKEIPIGISDNDSSVLKKVTRRAYHLDMLFNFFGYRVGYAGLIGLVPVVGDVASVILSLLLFKTAREVDGGLPIEVQLKFIGNIVIDFLLGLVPIVGDFVEVLYKANSRNALVLEKYLEEKAATAQLVHKKEKKIRKSLKESAIRGEIEDGKLRARGRATGPSSDSFGLDEESPVEFTDPGGSFYIEEGQHSRTGSY